MSHDHNNIKLRFACPPYCASHGDVITRKQNPVV